MHSGFNMKQLDGLEADDAQLSYCRKVYPDVVPAAKARYMGKTMDEIIQMGKGAISYGEDAIKKIEQSDDFKNFDRDLKDFINKAEEKGKNLKDDLLARGKEYDEKKNNQGTEVNNEQGQ